MYIQEVIVATATIGKWGNSLAVRIPGSVATTAKLADGDQVDIETVNDSIVVRPVVPRVTAASLFAGKSAAEWRAAYANAYDWGPDVGREQAEP